MSVRNHLCGLWDLVPISLLSAAQGCGGQMKAPATPAWASVRPLEGPRGGHPSAQHVPILSLSTAAFYFKLCVSLDHFLPRLDVSPSASQETLDSSTFPAVHSLDAYERKEHRSGV